MSKHSISIKLDQIGFGTVEVDDTDISDAVRGVDISAEVGSLPKVTLDLGLVEVRRFDAEQADVLIGSDARDALVRLGWTPPDYDHLIGQQVEVVNRAGLTKTGHLEAIGEGYMALRRDDGRSYVALEDVTSVKATPQD